jgi:CubicO group peptidase (beta-lactamase class C family)
MASLVADKLASWDDPASKWVPEFQLYDAALTRQVTLRDLSGNRLGIPRAGLVEFGFDPSQSAAAALEGLRHTAPVCGLRERHTYVNGGHTAVALAVGRITGKGFLPTLRERILAPLGMHATSGGVAARDELPDQSGWHCLVDGSTQAIDTVYSDWYLGGGGMSVSGADALQWLRLHLNGGLVDGQQILPREALLETHTPQIVAWPRKDIISLFHPGAHMAAYGLGWAVTELEGHPLVIHSGGDFGIAAMTLLFPRDGIGIACYCNSSGRGTVPLPYALAACLLGLKPRDWKAYFEAAMPANAPAPAVGESGRSTDPDLHAGRYSHPADGELVIERDGDGLRGNFLRGYRMAFTASPAGDRRFVIQFESPEWRSLTAVEKPLLVFDAGDGPSATVDWVVGSLSRRLTRDA